MDCESSIKTHSGKPTVYFANDFRKVYAIVSEIIPFFCSERPLRKFLIDEIKKRLAEGDEPLEEGGIGCVEHSDEVMEKFLELTVVLSITIFCNNINSILSRKIKVLPPNANCMEELARTFWVKKTRIAKHSDKFQN